MSGPVKHTPGPWTVAYLDRHDQAVVKGEHIEICTCWHHSVGSIEKEMHANARLIAAAPELLEALKAAMAFIDSHVADPDITDEMLTAYNRMKLLEPHALIARATGEAA